MTRVLGLFAPSYNGKIEFKELNEKFIRQYDGYEILWDSIELKI